MTTPHRSRLPYLLSPCCLALLLGMLFFAAAPVRSQNGGADAAERQRALQLFEQGKFTEAVPALEKLVTESPSDAALLSRLGFALFASTRAITDPGVRKMTLERARTMLLRARELGDDNDLSTTTLKALDSDTGEEVAYSRRQQADAAMHEAEAAFVQGDYPNALAAYKRAIEIDPKLYEAALYSGDVYFKSDQPEKAGEWFAKAIRINPDRETAYRYWGDTLMKAGKMDEARDKFIEAYLAEPYNRLAAGGLGQWAERSGIRLGHPKIDIPANVAEQTNGNVIVTIDPKALAGDNQDGSAAWLGYGLERAAWTNGKFAKAYPGEKVYRHSLREEAEALRLVAASASGQIKDRKIQRLDPALAMLVRLNDDGLLEAYILLARADQGIAQDYAAYRRTNRDKLRRYVVEYVFKSGGQ